MTTDFGPPQRVHVTVDIVEQARCGAPHAVPYGADG